jgi:hypothetical protein
VTDVTPADEAALSDTERQFLTYALDLAGDQMASRGNEFGAEDTAALETLRRLAGEAQQPETQARLAAYQTCGVCKSGYPTGGSCGTCAFNARMAAGARQADTAGEQQ